jgi:hypothetical protein
MPEVTMCLLEDPEPLSFRNHHLVLPIGVPTPELALEDEVF